METVFEQLGAWLNANEGVLEAVAVLLAVLTIAAPRLRNVFRKRDASGAPAIYDPDTMALHPAFLAALNEAQTGGLAPKDFSGTRPDSFFAPLGSRRKLKHGHKKGKNAPPETVQPSVAVFALDCLIGDDELKGFAAALSDEIATGLNSMSGYDIVAGRMTAGYEHQVSKLGARYLVEGSIRKVGSSIRLIVRLVDVETGRHIWAERFESAHDRLEHHEDIFVNQIVSGLTSVLMQSEADRAADADPDRLDAWSLTLLAFSGIVAGGLGSEGAEKAVDFASRAVEQDPNSGYAHAVKAGALVQLASFDGPHQDTVNEQEIRDLVRTALELSPRDPTVLSLVGFVRTNIGDVDEAVSVLEQAISLNPYNARGLASLGRALRNSGKPLVAIPKLERALTIAPNDSMAFLWASWLASCFLLSGQLNEAVEASRRAIDLNRNYYWPWLVMTAALSALGRDVEAADAYGEFELYRGTPTQESLETLIRESMGTRSDISVLVDGMMRAQEISQRKLTGETAAQ